MCCTHSRIDCCVSFLDKNSFMLGLHNEYPIKPRPDLILKIDNESENEELVEDLEQAVYVDEALIHELTSDDSE